MSNSDAPQDMPQDDMLRLTSEIVAAYVSHNEVPASEVPRIIRIVHDTLGALDSSDRSNIFQKQEPAVPIGKSVTPDHIICLEDGKKLKMLKRYLRTHYGLTPEEYRKKWGLPLDYPMVAPNYAAKRSEYAKQIGLGQTVDKRGKRKPQKADG